MLFFKFCKRIARCRSGKAQLFIFLISVLHKLKKSRSGAALSPWSGPRGLKKSAPFHWSASNWRSQSSASPSRPGFSQRPGCWGRPWRMQAEPVIPFMVFTPLHDWRGSLFRKRLPPKEHVTGENAKEVMVECQETRVLRDLCMHSEALIMITSRIPAARPAFRLHELQSLFRCSMIY